MDSWLAVPSVSSKGGDRTQRKRGPQPAAKKRRTDGGNEDGLRGLKELVKSTAELSLQSAKQLRVLSGMAVTTTLVQKNPAVEAAANVEVTPSQPLKADLERWGQLVNSLAKNSSVSSSIRALLTEHASSVQSKDSLFGKVLMCNVAQCFNDQNQYKVQIAVAACLQPIGTAILTALSELGGDSCFGPPPRLSAERAVAAALKQLR
jgi:hypothetical protein